MPRINPSQPPKAMTWGRATPTLALAIVFDVLRIFFELFWFFGPALLAAYCASKVGNIWFIGVALEAACVGAAMVVGSVALAPLAVFGTVMSIAFGLIGFLALGILILTTNPRLFKTSPTSKFWFIGGFMLAEVPFIGAIPTFSISLWRLYRAQIKKEHAALVAWQKAHAAEQLRERQIQAAQLSQARMAGEAANEAAYAAEAENDASYEAEKAPEEIPDQVRMVA